MGGFCSSGRLLRPNSLLDIDSYNLVYNGIGSQAYQSWNLSIFSHVLGIRKINIYLPLRHDLPTNIYSVIRREQLTIKLL